MKRRSFIHGSGASLLGASAFGGTGLSSASDGSASSVERSGRISLLDERWVHHSYFLTRRQARPERVSPDPILAPAGAACTIHPLDGGRFAMWYNTVRRVEFNGSRTHQSWVHYATSEDGVAFEKPDLGIHEGNVLITGNHIGADGKPITGVRGASGFCVLDAKHQKVPHARSRYTALYRAWVPGRHGGFSLAHSEDGLRWTEYPENPIRVGESDTFNNFFFDERIEKYVAYIRPRIHAGPRSVNRFVARITSDDMIHWGDEQVVLDTDERDAPAIGTIDEAKHPDGTGYPRGRNKQYYGLTATPYGDLTLGFASLYDVEPGTMTIELIHSYDGINWRREAQREALIPGGAADTWDAATVYYPGSGSPVEVGDDWIIYYHGLNFDHHMRNHSRPDLGEFRAMGAVRLKRDRLIGYEAGDAPGDLVTRPFQWNGDELFLNVNAKEGSARVAVCSESGNSLKGFHLSDALPVESDGVRVPVQFKSEASLSSLKGKRIRFRIYLEKASVFGWESG